MTTRKREKNEIKISRKEVNGEIDYVSF